MPDVLDRLTAALADRYAIQRELGSGGMATVYLAEDLKHKRKVAVKVLRPELAAVLGAERFVQEITTTANLQHPHILPLFDSGEADGFLYYVMPYVQGESLRDKLNRENRLPITEALDIAKIVASGLDYAHRQGVIHRDIKPENILLHDGQPILADFGIALAVSAAGGTRLTQTGLSLGTPEYMSPEQATADQQLDGRSDIYSLACVLYEMLTGEPPLTGRSAQSIIAKLLTEQPVRPRTLRDTIPGHVEAAILT
ncbi:MAG: serine/threonine-protein kinase, partial [Gemmatimonadales bacterium]